LARWDTFEAFGAEPAFESLRDVMLKQRTSESATGMTPDEKFVSDLYRVAVFVKIAQQ